MKVSRSLTSLLLLTVLCASPMPVFANEKEEPQTELGKRMDDISASWRKLRRQMNDAAQNASSIELIAQIRKASQGTEAMAPEKAAELPENRRAKFQADYAAGMKEFFAQLDALEKAFKAGDNAEAVKLVTAISDLQKKSHKEFRK